MERKPVHHWSSGAMLICKDCGLQDIVQYCADNHPESCRCINPLCPATSDEIREQHSKMDRTKHMAEVVKNKTDKIGSISSTYVITRTIGNRTVTLPGINPSIPYYDKFKHDKQPQPYLNGAGGGLVQVISVSVDFMMQKYNVISECSKHKNIQLEMAQITSDLIDCSGSFGADAFNQLCYTCPLCIEEVEKMKIYIKEQEKEEYSKFNDGPGWV